MRLHRMIPVTFTTMALICLPLLGAQRAGKQIKPTKTWSGRSGKTELKKMAPKSGVVANNKAWSKLWKAWRPDEKLPKVDFQKQVVVVSTINGPNRMFVSLNMNDKGEVRVLAGGTKIGGPGFGYHLAVVNRDGIKSINGKPLAGPGGDKSKD